MREWIKRNTLVVTAVVADDFGGFELHFDKGVKPQVIPMTGSKDWAHEYWRILLPGKSEEHFVVILRVVERIERVQVNQFASIG